MRFDTGLRRLHRLAAAGAIALAVTASLAQACTSPPHLATAMPESLSEPWTGKGASLAWYDGPTTRYAHGVLGDAIEGTRLHVYTEGALHSCGFQSVTLPDELVFEDIAPRLADVTGDDIPEIVVVQSHQRLGAQLAVYAISEDGVSLEQIAATPFIGRSNRWLAPVGIGDFDADGAVEIAYIDRPHLARTLRVWRFVAPGELVELAALEGLTNHRIGEPFITGGVRICGAGPELITADATWTQIMATTLAPDGTLTTRALGAFSRAAVEAALECR